MVCRYICKLPKKTVKQEIQDKGMGKLGKEYLRRGEARQPEGPCLIPRWDSTLCISLSLGRAQVSGPTWSPASVS